MLGYGIEFEEERGAAPTGWFGDLCLVLFIRDYSCHNVLWRGNGGQQRRTKDDEEDVMILNATEASPLNAQCLYVKSCRHGHGH